MGFLSSFFGGDQRKDLKRAKAASDAALKQGYDAATGRYGEAYDALTPYEDQGQAANTAYGATIGLGTDAQRQGIYDSYMADPGQQGLLGLQSNAMLRRLNAQGSGTGGGQLALAGARVGQENWNNYINRLRDAGTQGGQYATSQSNIKMGQGDLDWGYGATRAGNAINFGNSMAQSRSIGVNNLLGAVGAATKIAGLF